MPPPIASPPPPPAAQTFADTDPGYAFADPDRKAKLLAAAPKFDAALADELVKQGVGGVSVGLVIDGELVWSKGYGVVDVDTRAVPDAETQYRIGSISKSFSALGILALRDEGALRLDDPLVDYVPEASKLVYPTHDSRPITLRQLLTHTSGLVRDVDFAKTGDERTFLDQLAGLPLDNPPGQQWVYSNLGFALLGIIVGRASHTTVADALARRVFGPLGMTSTGVDESPKLAPAYEPDNHSRRAKTDHLGVAAGAGGIYSTVRDMAKYVALQLSAYPARSGPDTGIVKRATLRDAHSTGVLNGANVHPRDAKRGEPTVELGAASYGFGWQHHITCLSDDLVEHSGAIDSYRANVQFLTHHGVGVVVLSNFGNANTFAFGARVIDELRATGALQPYVAHPTVLPALDKTVQAFLGVYNHWDPDALQRLLARPIGPEEKDELAGYHQLHGACSAVTLVEATSSREARYAATCEHGALELTMIGAPDGRLRGFFGTSRKVAPPPEVEAAAKTVLALVARWDEALFARTFADPTHAHDMIKRSLEQIRAEAGTCKRKEFVHEAFDWRFEATCERGPDRRFELGLTGPKISRVTQRPLEQLTCPVK